MCLHRPKPRIIAVLRTTCEFLTISSPSTVNFAREAIMKSRSFCVIAATGDVTCSACHPRWTKSQRVTGCALSVLQRMHMVSLKGTNTPCKSLRRRPAHSRTTTLAAQLLPSRSALAAHCCVSAIVSLSLVPMHPLKQHDLQGHAQRECENADGC